MQVSVETLEGLERKLTVSVPTAEVEKEVSARLKTMSSKVKIDGFRPGKASMDIITRRYSDSIRQEVAKDLVQSTLMEALNQNALVPADLPNVELTEFKKNEDLKYIARFEVFPVFEVAELNKIPVELIRSEVSEQDVKNMLEKLRHQQVQWNEVSHSAKKDNKVIIDFEGFIEDVAFEGGSAKAHELILGSGSMIPGFEDAILGKNTGDPFDIQVTFPEDYGHSSLSNKEATFKITIHKILESELPELNDEFAEKFNITSGGIDALSKDIKDNMDRTLESRLNHLNKNTLFDHLMKQNPIDLPSALIEKQIEHLKHDAYHRIFGNEHKENEKIPDFPRVLFEEQAKRGVHLGLLISEYIKKHALVADPDRVSALIEKLAASYESPDACRRMYRTNKEHMADLEGIILEEMVSEKIASDATVIYITKDYETVTNPPQGTEIKGE